MACCVEEVVFGRVGSMNIPITLGELIILAMLGTMLLTIWRIEDEAERIRAAIEKSVNSKVIRRKT